MPEHLQPGVYVEELPSGFQPISAVGTGTAGFSGLAERGPVEPRLITGWDEFTRFYGDAVDPNALDSYLPWAVKGFFDNGGRRAYVARVVAADAVPVTAELSPGLTLEAIGPGDLTGRLFCRVLESASGNPKEIRVVVACFRESRVPGALGDLPFTSPDEPAVWEDFDNVPWDGLGTVLEQSSLVRPAAGSTPLIRPEAGEWAAFSGGSVGGPVALGDYLGSSGGTDHPATGLAALAEIDSISILCVPDDVHPAHRGIASGITEAIVRQCEALRDRFAVLQLPRDAGGGDPNSIAPPAQSGFAAVYHPWLRVADDLAAATRFVPPGGHIAGIYARTDSSRGIHKSTANEQVLGTVAGPGGEVPLDPEIGELEQDLLARRNINIIRDFRTMGRGIRVWGARTLTADPEWKYVSVRRLVMWLEKSIHRGTAWVEFEPNAAPTWQRVRQQVAAFLTEEWRKGALLGSKPEEAFFVNVDRTTMTQDDIATGRLVAVVGVAPLRPAEFVIFRIGQKTADATR